MACDPDPRTTTLVSSAPTASAAADVTIAHVQLRDLIVCPKDRGILWYVSGKNIVEHNILRPNATPSILAELSFVAVTLATLCIDSNKVLLAAGGQEEELHLALYSYLSKAEEGSSEPQSSESTTGRLKHSDQIWEYNTFLYGSKINNSVLLYLPPPVSSYHLNGSVESPSPRLIISNNDRNIKFFDVSLEKDGYPVYLPEDRLRRRPRVRAVNPPQRVKRLESVGTLRLNVPVNHTSISPDGTTLLSCGDSPDIYLHRLSPAIPGTPLTFQHLATFSLPESTLYPAPSPRFDSYSYLPHPFSNDIGPLSSCFSTSWSSDGSKFVVASQEGMVVVWDVRSKVPLSVGRWETPRADERRQIGRHHILRDNDGDCFIYDLADDAGSSSAGPSSTDHNGTDQAVPIPFNDSRFDQYGIHDAGLWYEHVGGEPPPAWGVRSVKFMKNVNGREVLIFTEHASLVHVVDADTFQTHEIFRVSGRRRPSAAAERHRAEQVLRERIALFDGASPSQTADPALQEHLALLDRPSEALGPRPAGPSLRRIVPPRSYYSGYFDATVPRRRPLQLAARGGSRALASASPRGSESGMRERAADLNYRIEEEIWRREQELSDDENVDMVVIPPLPDNSNRPYSRPPRQLATRTGPRASGDDASGGSGSGMLQRMAELNAGIEEDANLPHQRPPRQLATRTGLRASDVAASGGSEVSLRERMAERDIGMEEDIRRHEREQADDENPDVVVIPPLPDEESQEAVRRVLSRHGFSARTSPIVSRRISGSPVRAEGASGSDGDVSRRARSSNGTADEDESGMDVDGEDDELQSEQDCTPPRVLSPSPGTPAPATATSSAEPVEAPPAQYGEVQSSDVEVNIAGLTFDETGSYMYVATEHGIAEWSIQGVETKWWCGGAWA